MRLENTSIYGVVELVVRTKKYNTYSKNYLWCRTGNALTYLVIATKTHTHTRAHRTRIVLRQRERESETMLHSIIAEQKYKNRTHTSSCLHT